MLMMQSNEVKAGLSEVLRKVEAGQEIAITRHGRVVARLLPAYQNSDKSKYHADVVERIRQLRCLRLRTGENIASLVAEWKEEGRR